MKKALITGITGMDGSHMADFLLAKGYDVYGLERYKSAGSDYTNIASILDKITLIKGDLLDTASLLKALEISEPDEVYNFAAQSFVGSSWDIAEYTGNVTGLGVLRLLEAIKAFDSSNKIKLAQASSSEMFGKRGVDADEYTTFRPESPYAIAKIFAHHTVHTFRNARGMFACCSICFNHESERRGYQFVTRKISNGAAKILLGLADTLSLGNLDAARDWGDAPEYVEGIWKMLQYNEPTDFVFATGQSHTVAEFVDVAFNYIGIPDWKRYIIQDKRFMRPADVNLIRGNFTRAKHYLGWEPRTDFPNLVRKMVDNDVQLLNRS